jgi:predicted GNAT family N-acyltransferase
MTTQAFVTYSIEEEIEFTIDSEGDEHEVSTEYWLINLVFVPVAERGQGKARQMLTDAIADMKAQRRDLEIKLWTEAQDAETCNEKLAAFYESMGFEATGNGAEMILN